LTGSVISNLLVLAVAALIVDEVVARRQRRARAVSVAVQGLIVYGQARRAYQGIVGVGTNDPGLDASDELRTLASMVLTASPSLFDDPDARRFLEQVERLSVSLVRTLAASAGDGQDRDGTERVTSQMSEVQASVAPLVARIPPEDRAALEGLPLA
jgi:hypothetical protein